MKILITVVLENGETVQQDVDLRGTPGTGVLDATATAIRRAYADGQPAFGSDDYYVIDGPRGISEAHLVLARMDAEGTSY